MVLHLRDWFPQIWSQIWKAYFQKPYKDFHPISFWWIVFEISEKLEKAFCLNTALYLVNRWPKMVYLLCKKSFFRCPLSTIHFNVLPLFISWGNKHFIRPCFVEYFSQTLSSTSKELCTPSQWPLLFASAFYFYYTWGSFFFFKIKYTLESLIFSLCFYVVLITIDRFLESHYKFLHPHFSPSPGGNLDSFCDFLVVPDRLSTLQSGPSRFEDDEEVTEPVDGSRRGP